MLEISGIYKGLAVPGGTVVATKVTDILAVARILREKKKK
jgi:hypothetical protein